MRCSVFDYVFWLFSAIVERLRAEEERLSSYG